MRELWSEGPAAWTAEWEMRGEVVFPQRRSLYWRLGLFGFLTLSSGWQLVDNLRDETESTFITVAAAVAPPIWCWMFGYHLAGGHSPSRHSRRRRRCPRRDKRTRLPWDRIASATPSDVGRSSSLSRCGYEAGWKSNAPLPASPDDQGGRARPGDLWHTGDI